MANSSSNKLIESVLLHNFIYYKKDYYYLTYERGYLIRLYQKRNLVS